MYNKMHFICRNWGKEKLSVVCGFSSIKIHYSLNSINDVYVCEMLYCLFRCNRTCYCIGMVSVTSASRYVTSALRYQIRPSNYIRGLIPRN